MNPLPPVPDNPQVQASDPRASSVGRRTPLAARPGGMGPTVRGAALCGGAFERTAFARAWKIARRAHDAAPMRICESVTESVRRAVSARRRRSSWNCVFHRGVRHSHRRVLPVAPPILGWGRIRESEKQGDVEGGSAAGGQE